jgi:hypothetical protein
VHRAGIDNQCHDRDWPQNDSYPIGADVAHGDRDWQLNELSPICSSSSCVMQITASMILSMTSMCHRSQQFEAPCSHTHVLEQHWSGVASLPRRHPPSAADRSAVTSLHRILFGRSNRIESLTGASSSPGQNDILD